MKKNIIFCGTPTFATASLKTLFKLHEDGCFNLSTVITIPDKKSGRGQKMKESEVKKVAKNLNIPILEPTDLSSNEFISQVKLLKPDLMIVIAFKKLPKILFEIPTLGTINLHASLLPKYRGAAPINWAIINGETQTGLTTFFINEKIDSGDIILQSKINIPIHWHADDLHDKLMHESSHIITRTVDKVFSNNYNLKKQPDLKSNTIIKRFSIAPKIHKQDRIFNREDFKGDQGLKKLYNFIRGHSPPGVKMEIEVQTTDNRVRSQTILITRVSNYTDYDDLPDLGEDYYVDRHGFPTGASHELTIAKTSRFPIGLPVKKENRLIIKTSHGGFQIDKLKPENGKEMSDKEFINGFLTKDYKDIGITPHVFLDN